MTAAEAPLLLNVSLFFVTFGSGKNCTIVISLEQKGLDDNKRSHSSESKR